ncbi:MAG: hypothetical protein AAF902_16590 [Chloroflexota bacterium]
MFSTLTSTIIFVGAAVAFSMMSQYTFSTWSEYTTFFKEMRNMKQ